MGPRNCKNNTVTYASLVACWAYATFLSKLDRLPFPGDTKNAIPSGIASRAEHLLLLGEQEKLGRESIREKVALLTRRLKESEAAKEYVVDKVIELDLARLSTRSVQAGIDRLKLFYEIQMRRKIDDMIAIADPAEDQDILDSLDVQASSIREAERFPTADWLTDLEEQHCLGEAKRLLFGYISPCRYHVTDMTTEEEAEASELAILLARRFRRQEPYRHKRKTWNTFWKRFSSEAAREIARSTNKIAPRPVNGTGPNTTIPVYDIGESPSGQSSLASANRSVVATHTTLKWDQSKSRAPAYIHPLSSDLESSPCISCLVPYIRYTSSGTFHHPSRPCIRTLDACLGLPGAS